MKTTLSFLLISLPIFGFSQIDVSGTIDDKANEKTGDAIDAVWSAPGKILEKKKEKKEEEAKKDSTKTETASTAKTNEAVTGSALGIAAYQNYDFVPGSDLIFNDNFIADEEGEFPAHWKLSAGQGAVNKIQNTSSFCLTQGNYAKVFPKNTNANYLGNAFTVETDLYSAAGDFGLVVFFYIDADQLMTVALNQSSVVCEFPGGSLNADYPVGCSGTNFQNKWHHIAISCKEHTLKIYVDQNRVLLVPDCACAPTSIGFGGLASNENPIKFSNVRIANGAKINMLDKLNTDEKIISYGFSFNPGQSNLLPQSMGTINQLYKLLTDNPTLKIEIDGFTDSDGDDNANQQLSEDRANAVRDQLVKMGIEGSRIAAKGLGETNPIGDNQAFDGKAKNQRVEILKRK